MDMIASAFGCSRIAVGELDPRREAARYCLREYYSELSRRFKGGFDAFERPRCRRFDIPARCVSLSQIVLNNLGVHVIPNALRWAQLVRHSMRKAACEARRSAQGVAGR